MASSLCRCCRSILTQRNLQSIVTGNLERSGAKLNHIRLMSVRAKKRFYKKASLVNEGKANFEITLDSKKLKTPGGTPLTVVSEPLALAVAHEWNSQKEIVLLSQMHLTGLCSIAIDNPTKATKYDLVDNVLNFLETDTILFFSDDQENLYTRQKLQWQPIIDWFCERYQITISPSTSLAVPPKISAGAREVIRRHLLSYNFEAVHGFAFGIDAIKSIPLMCAIIDNRLTIDEAVRLSRLELDFQIEHWGNVEWAHELELYDTTARVAAAALFVQCNTSQYLAKHKEEHSSL